MEASRVLLVLSVFCMTTCLARHGLDTGVCQPEIPGVGDRTYFSFNNDTLVRNPQLIVFIMLSIFSEIYSYK